MTVAGAPRSSAVGRSGSAGSVRLRWGVVARAVAHLPILAEYLLPLVKIGGQMLAQKGKEAEQEAKQAENAFTTLGGELRQIVSVTLPGVDARALIVIAKIHRTPDRYPRRVGIPSKRPL